MEHSDIYEDWAIGILDESTKSAAHEQATALFTPRQLICTLSVHTCCSHLLFTLRVRTGRRRWCCKPSPFGSTKARTTAASRGA